MSFAFVRPGLRVEDIYTETPEIMEAVKRLSPQEKEERSMRLRRCHPTLVARSATSSRRGISVSSRALPWPPVHFARAVAGLLPDQGCWAGMSRVAARRLV